jgi:hypothetical protein
VLKTDRYVKVYGFGKVKGWPKCGSIKKFKMDSMTVSGDKDPKINKYYIREVIMYYLFIFSNAIFTEP